MANSTIFKQECSDCLETLRVDLFKGEARATTRSSLVAGVYSHAPEDPNCLWMWECPSCGYADSYINYGD